MTRERDRTSGVLANVDAVSLADVVAACLPGLTNDAEHLLVRLAQARLPGTGLIAMTVGRDNGQFVATAGDGSYVMSAIDAARTTRGLVELATALADTNLELSHSLALAAARNWEATREAMRDGGQPVHERRFDAAGKVLSTTVGERGTAQRVNADGAYPLSDSIALLQAAEALDLPELAAQREIYQAALMTDIVRFFDQFYDPAAGTFAYHSDPKSRSHAEDAYPNGVVGNDGTVYALAALLVPTLRVLGHNADRMPTGAKPFTTVVKDQLDLLSGLDREPGRRFEYKNGGLWENYAIKSDGGLEPIRFEWQDQEVKPPVPLPDGGLLTRSHVAIGGHTVMAAGQIVEGAVELERLGAIDSARRQRYLKRAVEIVQNAIDSGVIDGQRGVVQNANMLEVPLNFSEQRTKPGGSDWGQAGWQQRELMQTLIALREAGHLRDLRLPSGGDGETLLKRSIATIARDFPIPADYRGGFADEHRYHAPQAVAYLWRLESDLSTHGLEPQPGPRLGRALLQSS